MSVPIKSNWRQFFAIISKSGNFELAARQSRIGTNNARRKIANSPALQRKLARALKSYQQKVMDGKIGHDRVGRPRQTLSEATKERFLYCLAQTGSVRAATSIVGVNPSSLYRLQNREPDFMIAWHRAAEDGDGVQAIAGAWTRREREFADALPRVGWDVEAAAELAGIPARLATMMHDRPRPERVTVQSARPDHHPTKQPDKTTTAELKAEQAREYERRMTPQMRQVVECMKQKYLFRREAAAELNIPWEEAQLWENENRAYWDEINLFVYDYRNNKLMEDEKRMTPKMMQFVQCLKRDLTQEQAAAELNITMEEVDTWQKENSYFCMVISPD